MHMLAFGASFQCATLRTIECCKTRPNWKTTRLGVQKAREEVLSRTFRAPKCKISKYPRLLVDKEEDSPGSD